MVVSCGWVCVVRPNVRGQLAREGGNGGGSERGGEGGKRVDDDADEPVEGDRW